MMEETLEGGYRQSGQSPVKQAGMPVVSVITVVYNSLSLIEKTIRSIIGQTYPNIEFIVIDGGSSDGTAEIIRLYEKQISWWISEPDRGIYDAMNKGLAAATGDYVWFMNAGDRIYAEDTLGKIFALDPSAGTDGIGTRQWAKIFYGDAMIMDSAYREVGLRRLRPPEVLTWKSFKKGMLVCHQAIIVSREIAEPFDPQYQHSADFDWVVRALIKAQGSRLKAQVRSKEYGVGSKEYGVGSKEYGLGSKEYGVGSKEYGVGSKEYGVGSKEYGVGSKEYGVGSKEYGVGSKEEQELIIESEVQTGGSRRREGSDPAQDSGIIAPQLLNPSTHQPINPSTHQPINNTHLVLCAFLDGGHSKRNIGISLRERFHSMVRHYGLIPTVLRHIPIAVRFGWYYLTYKRF